MIRSSARVPRSPACLAVALALAAVSAPAPARAQPVATPSVAEPTAPYTVKRGDTCVGIANRELGDRRAYAEIHRLNPRLGHLPHRLRPGMVLRVPGAVVATGADARISGQSGTVRVRPADSDTCGPIIVSRPMWM